MKKNDAKVGRNDPCWCGSGRKFKRCHGVFEMAPRPSKGEIAEIGHKFITHRTVACHHPDAPATCSGKIIEAHSVQRGKGLNRIARRGEVYYFKDTMGFIMDPSKPLEPSLVGAKEASVFPGFCSYHDCKTFRPIDDGEFCGTPEQIFLIAYRAMCREFAGLLSRREALPGLFGLVRGLRGTSLQAKLDGLVEHRLINDYNLAETEREKKLYDKMLTTRVFDKLAHYIILFGKRPDLLCTAFVQPLCDFSGKAVQHPDLSHHWQSVAFSIVASDAGGAAVFSWSPDHSPGIDQFIRTLSHVPEARLTDTVIRFAFEYSDNICLSPQWWESLDRPMQGRFLTRFQSGLAGGAIRREDSLLDDGIHAADWGFLRRQTNAEV